MLSRTLVYYNLGFIFIDVSIILLVMITLCLQKKLLRKQHHYNKVKWATKLPGRGSDRLETSQQFIKMIKTTLDGGKTKNEYIWNICSSKPSFQRKTICMYNYVKYSSSKWNQELGL